MDGITLNARGFELEPEKSLHQAASDAGTPTRREEREKEEREENFTIAIPSPGIKFIRIHHGCLLEKVCTGFHIR